MSRTFILAAAVLGALGVALGAFGAHGLGALLEAHNRTATFDTATQYQLIHALALLAAAWLAERDPGRWVRWAGILFIAGVILFSGSLYILSILDLRIMGAVAPLGGTALILGWACLGCAAWSSKR
ncbi:MAG: DUF423 domain-containing protein [Anaerolineae bacterium]|jgi:uncharacterized membrane protein YgdD (TMEM256/DUF423 family)|nr:DUF423 domain-containing protein [Anaerolineae bacterium]